MGKNIFNSVQLKKPNNNVFDLSHDIKLSFNMGELVPVCCMEAVPGDKFDIGSEALIRFAPLIAPVMHRMNVTIHYFFVPNRILWHGWESFITGYTGVDGTGPTPPAFPFIDLPYNNVTPLADYLGIPLPPVGATGTERISAMPFAAYQKIWLDYYRDQNLQDVDVTDYNLADGDNTANALLIQMHGRAWQHDYFTSALPWAQKGAAVTMPIAGTDVRVFSNRSGGGTSLTGTPDNQALGYSPSENAGIPADALYADTSTMQGSATINDLRRSFRLQEWLERNARAGTRYVESILAHFGVKSSDKRLQRPEYITGIKSPVVISEILNTAGTFDSADPDNPTSPPQGNMSGHGISVASGRYGKYFCEEHGYVVGIMSCMPVTAYQQGIPKHFLKYTDPYQYFWPEFANIGEQPVLNRELYASYGLDGLDDNTFGYVPRYAEYKYMASRVAGDFRSTLNFWHLGRIFDTRPALNEAFVEADPTTRVFAVTDEDQAHLYAHVLNKIRAVRPMPKYGTPSF